MNMYFSMVNLIYNSQSNTALFQYLIILLFNLRILIKITTCLNQLLHSIHHDQRLQRVNVDGCLSRHISGHYGVPYTHGKNGSSSNTFWGEGLSATSWIKTGANAISKTYRKVQCRFLKYYNGILIPVRTSFGLRQSGSKVYNVST